MTDDLLPEAYKHAFVTMVSRDLLLGMGLAKPTPEEQATLDREQAEWREQRKVGYRETLVYLEALDAITDPTSRAVLDMHVRSAGPYGWSTCEGCDYAGWEGEPPDWPCRTVDLIAGLHGVEKPDLPTFGEPH